MPTIEGGQLPPQAPATVSSAPPLRQSIGAWPQRAADWLEDGGALWVLGAGMAVYAVVDLWATRGITLFVDEQFEFVQNNGLDPSALLAPLDGHLVLLERLMYAVDFKLFGASFLLPRLVEPLGVLLLVGLFFVLVRRRIGAAAALAPAMLLLFFGSAWEQDLVTSGIGGHTFAVAGGLGALLALDGSDSRSRSAQRDLIACVSLIVAVAAFTLGVPFALGVLVLILMQPNPRRHVWVALVPLALYAAWQLWVRAAYVPTHGEVDYLAGSNILLIPNYIADAASSVLGALAGLNYAFQPSSSGAFATGSEYGALLATLAFAALVLRLRRVGIRSPFLWALISVLLVYWVVLGLAYSPGRDPTTVREVYGAGVLILLIGAEAARGVRLSPAWIGPMYLITLLALAGNVSRLREGERYYRSYATSLRAQLTAIELARGHVSPSFSLGSNHFNEYITAGPYLAAVDRNGSPAYPLAELLRQPGRVRHDADSTLVAALGIGTSPHSSGAPVTSCRRLISASGGSTTFAVVPPGVMLNSPTAALVAVRRFASVSTVVGGLLAGRPQDLRIPTDRSTRRWQVSVTPAPPSLTLCELGAAP
jgi:hypothetical protein